MNKDQINKNIGSRIKLKPIAININNNEELDDDWIIENVMDNGVLIKNIRNNHKIILGFDHIHSYFSDPNRDVEDLKYEILVLHVQIIIKGKNISIEPTEKPGKPIEKKDLWLNEVIDWSAIKPAIRKYLIANDISKISDANKINFDDMLQTKDIGKIGIQKLIIELVSKGILKETSYLKMFLNK